MENPHTANRRKGKEIATGSARQRHDNWSDAETIELLDAIEIHLNKRGYPGISFANAEYGEITTLFQEKILNTTRDRLQVTNIIQVLVKMFRVSKDLANRSGGGWDDETHRPIAPSQSDYIDMIKAKGSKANFLLRGRFPWFNKMYPMVAGQTAKGFIRNFTYNRPDSSQAILITQGSAQGSETGNSDDPDEFSKEKGTSETVQQGRRWERRSSEKSS